MKTRQQTTNLQTILLALLFTSQATALALAPRSPKPQDPSLRGTIYSSGPEPLTNPQTSTPPPSGINPAGKIVLLVFLPLGGLMILGTFYYVFFHDRFTKEGWERRAAIKEEVKREKEEERKRKGERAKRLDEMMRGVREGGV